MRMCVLSQSLCSGGGSQVVDRQVVRSVLSGRIGGQSGEGSVDGAGGGGI